MKTETEVKPFHEWKEEVVKADSEKHGVFKFYRLRDWYFKAYGAYCAKHRKSLKTMTEEDFNDAHGC